jgi:hypothetical protein
MAKKLLLSSMMASVAFSETLEALFWTETNEKFARSPYHEISVKIGDKMDLICPRFDDGKDHNNHMYHRIYEVSAEAFQNCDTSQGKRLIDCNKPEQEKKYTVLFQDTNPSPYGLEFLPGQTYYYISTSSGIDLDGMFQSQGGGCQNSNMKLAIKVKPEEDIVEEIVMTEFTKIANEVKNTEMMIEAEKKIMEETTPGSLLMGVGLGAFGVLLLVLIIIAAYKLYRKRHPSNDKMLYMSPVDVSRVPLPVHPVHPSEVKLMMSHQGGAMTHQASPPPPYGMNYTTLVPCTQGYPTSVGYHPSQMNLTNNDSEYQSDHSTNHSYITRDSFPIHNGDVCEV